MVLQSEFTLHPRSRGFHLITDEVAANLPQLPATGLVHLFIRHTSAGLSINENADPDVRTDLAAIFDRLVREREPYYVHTLEGDDDMPAHAKSTLTGTDLTIPVSGGQHLAGHLPLRVPQPRGGTPDRSDGDRRIAAARRSDAMPSMSGLWSPISVMRPMRRGALARRIPAKADEFGVEVKSGTIRSRAGKKK